MMCRFGKWCGFAALVIGIFFSTSPAAMAQSRGGTPGPNAGIDELLQGLIDNNFLLDVFDTIADVCSAVEAPARPSCEQGYFDQVIEFWSDWWDSL